MTIRTFALPAALPTLSVRRELDRLFDDVFVNRGATPATLPAAEAREDATGYTLLLDIPGVDPEQVEVLAEDGVLTVKGARAERALAEGERALFTESARGSFSRRFRLPKDANLEAVQASYAHGVLSVRVEKLAPAQPRRVTVQVQQ